MKLGFSSFISDYFQQNLFFKKTYMCVSGGKLDVLCLLETPVLRLALLLY